MKEGIEVRVRKKNEPGLTSMEIGSLEIEVSPAMAKKYGMTKGLAKLGRAMCRRFKVPAVVLLGITFNRRYN